jgi:Asp-tRNA(Asn)/Glu-tRNA(Gln) amidotransferase A subunit family amidase
VGLPAISLPIGLSQAGLPIGAQFVVSFGADASLLAFSAGLEAAMPPPSLPKLDD